jgi:hypothetical protein
VPDPAATMTTIIGPTPWVGGEVEAIRAEFYGLL